jgi:hypothetical protein
LGCIITDFDLIGDKQTVASGKRISNTFDRAQSSKKK